MSYLALARKWRPRRFEDVMGQAHVVRALSHALDQDRLHPAILLTGTRGVGKTTLARILAKGLNCEVGIGANPCGVCGTCTAVDAGRFVDLLEIDAASNTGVDNVRELIDNSQYAPVSGRYKVYLIDEVHMLSKAAFNALLKTLEEPPGHVKFVLATTDPQKLPITVLSRCLQFNLKRLPVSVIRDQLAMVLQQEDIAFDTAAVGELARAADGSMRDGLSLLDQAIAFASGAALSRELIEDMLGSVGRARVHELLSALADGDGPALLELLRAIDAQSPDFAGLLNDIAANLQRIAVLQQLPDARDEDDDDALLSLVPRFAPEDVQLYYQIATHGRRDLPWAPDPRIGFEMTVLRMLAFRPDDGEAGNATPGSAPAAIQAGSRTGSPAPSPRSASAAPPADAAAPAPQARPNPPEAAAAARPVTPPPPPTATPPRQEPPAVASVAAEPARTQRPLPGNATDWEACVDAIEVDGAIRNLARQCAFGAATDGVLQLALAETLGPMLNETRRAALEAALSSWCGSSIRVAVTMVVESETLDSPAQQTVNRMTQRQRDAEASIAADPVVMAFQEHFGAQVRAGSIHPT